MFSDPFPVRSSSDVTSTTIPRVIEDRSSSKVSSNALCERRQEVDRLCVERVPNARHAEPNPVIRREDLDVSGEDWSRFHRNDAYS
jgi:hypothetical protein